MNITSFLKQKNHAFGNKMVQTRTLRHLLAGTRNMPSQKGKRAKSVQMTEQQTKIPQIIDIVQIPATQDIV
jgi:hypothetical protein